MQDHQKPDKLNLLKGGIVYSDSLTTVSPTYAKEIQGKEGFGLGPLITAKKDKLQGILNGIDTTYWNPETDPFLKKNYPADARSLEELLEGKRENRQMLQKRLQMDPHPAPLFACISRLVRQKGPEMIAFGIEHVLKKGGQFILLGSTPEPSLKEMFDTLAKKYRNNPHAHFHFLYDEELAHLTYAAADFILVPSLFEPCGLTQMIALRYGALPIVHKVGGLSDTINKGNGYPFDRPTNKSLGNAIDRALKDTNRSKTLINGLKTDWSWRTPARAYLETYKVMHKANK